jgi:predicted enzyme related to lactoylglutathione lyase
MDAPSSCALTAARFELFVRDVAQSVRFYERVLDFVAPSDADLTGYVPVRNGAVTIGLQAIGALGTDHHLRRGRADDPRGLGVEIVLQAADVDRAYRHAAATAPACGGVTEPIGERPWGRRDFRVIDPDGYYLRLTS